MAIILYNQLTNTFPVVLHSPGPQKNPVFYRACKLPKKSVVEEATIITWNSSTKPCLLEQHQSCHVLGRGISDWDNSIKIELTHQFIGRVSTKYVMGFDGFDVLVFDPQEVLHRFCQMDCRMLVSADKTFFPCGFDNVTSEWMDFQKDVSVGDYKYLNGGAWIAETDFFESYIDRCGERLEEIRRMVIMGDLPSRMPSYQLENGAYCHPRKSPDKSEQMVWNSVFSEFFPDVVLDCGCLIFQTVSPCNRDVRICNMLL